MNLFDGFIVIISLVEIIALGGGNKAVSAFRTVRIFRTFRVLRVTKLLRSLAFMKVIIDVVSKSMQSFFYIAVLLLLFIFIYTLLGIQIFGGKTNFPDSNIRANFNSFHDAFITVFQVLTLENWQQILFICMRSSAGAFLTNLFLISWIFIGNYVLLNLFLAILLDGFTEYEDEDEKKEVKPSNFKEIEPANDENFEIYDEEDVEINLKKKTQEFIMNKNFMEDVECEDSLFFIRKEI